MQSYSRNQMVLLPIAKKKKSSGRVPQHNVLQLESVRYEDFPAQSSHHFTGLRLAALVVVIVGVTLGMLISFFFLFSGGNIHLTFSSFTLQSSPSALSLVGIGCGIVVVLWITFSYLLKQKHEGVLAQRSAILPMATLVSTGGKTIFPPEPVERYTDELFLADFDTRVDRWISSEWDGEPQKNTDKLEALHMRQRLRKPRLSYVDNFPGDDDKEYRYQIQKADVRVVCKRKTNSLMYEDDEA